MLIESATVNDIEAITAIVAESDDIHRDQLPHIFCEQSGPIRPPGFLRKRIEGPDSVILVAREGSEVVGILEAEIPAAEERDGFVVRRIAGIDNVVVTASRRGQGIGTRLIEHAHRWATARGAETTRLHVWASNPQARRLYERLGYETVLYRMERRLVEN